MQSYVALKAQASAESLMAAALKGMTHLSIGEPLQHPNKQTSWATAANFPIDAETHELMIQAHLRAADVTSAQHHLRSLEQTGPTPSLTAYHLVLAGLIAAQQPGAAWNLFAHMRLVSHPVPNADVYTVMIRACARGNAPERALDLRLDMTENGVALTPATYAALILACARGPSNFYYDGLRLMREMLNMGYHATREVMHAVLHGAMRQGDLARARWVFVRMVSAAESDPALGPDTYALRCLLHAYAVYKPPKGMSANLPTLDTTPRSTTPHSTAPSSALPAVSEVAPAVDGDDQFPGPMPQTTGETLVQVRRIMQRLLGAHGLANVQLCKAPATHSTPHDDPIFARIKLDNRLVDAFLDAVLAHGTFPDMRADYGALYAIKGVEHDVPAAANMMDRCRKTSHFTSALASANAVFTAWQKDAARTTGWYHGVAIKRIWSGMIFALARLVVFK